MLFNYLERQPSTKLSKVTYETATGCEALMERFRTVLYQFIGKRRKILKTGFLRSLAIDMYMAYADNAT